MKITIIAGARPNFMKIAPIVHEIQKQQKTGASVEFRIVHTGQHYDKNLSDTFFSDLNIPLPDINLNVSGGSHAFQTAEIMKAFERELMGNPSDLVLVVGDVNSTMACAVVAKKLNIKVAHVESGIRSGDMKMPEEINRIVTDSITDYFFTTSRSAGQNLIREGKEKGQIFFVGNVMIDTLMVNLPRLKKPGFWKERNLTPGEYFVLTLHRPSNVDDPKTLKHLVKLISENSKGLPVIFPVHPRTRPLLEELDLYPEKFHLVEPMGYLEFMFLVKNSRAVLTDSGGISEETTVLHIPCMTFRDTTERPETLEIGTNRLVGNETRKIKSAFSELHEGTWKSGGIPELWDGKASKRIVSELLRL